MRTLKLEVTSAVTWRKMSYSKPGSVTGTRASGRRIRIYVLVRGSAGSVMMAMQKCHPSRETSLGEISSTRTAAESGSVGIMGEGDSSSTLGTVVITYRRVELRLL